MPLDIDYYTREARHTANRAARWTGGAMLRGLANMLSGGGSVSLGLAAANRELSWMSGAAGTFSVGLSAGVNAFLNYKEYQHSQNQLLRYYGNEIAAKLGKSHDSLTLDDLQAAAEFNPTLDEEIKRHRRAMHVDTGVSLLCTILAYGAVAAAFTAFTALAAAPLLAGVTIAISTSYLAHKVITPVAERLFNIHEKTPIDRIRNMEISRHRGRNISQEQVLGVYAAASPDLQKTIRKEFGTHFDNLSLIKQHEAVLRYGPTLQLEAVTQAINENRLSVRELAFTVHGDRSGAYPEPTLHQQVQERIGNLKQSISHGRAAATQKWNDFTSRMGEKSQELVNSGKGWVQSLGLKPKSQDISWEQKMAQEKSSNQELTTSPTLH